MPKPFCTYEQQIQLLRGKQMIVADEAFAKDMLRRCGYFALISGYKDLLKDPTTKNYRNGTRFEDIVVIYQFDEQLRELTLRHLLQVERNIRSALSYAFCDIFGDSQTAYLSVQNYDASSPAKQKQINKLINILTDLITKPQKYPYINHYKANQQDVPLWALVNALSFGTISKFYELSKPQIQSAISRDFSSINESQLRKLLEVLTDFRNVCAHNERLFVHCCAKHDIPDLKLHKKLAIPRKGQNYIYGKRDYFAVVLALRYLLPHTEFLKYKRGLGRLIDDLCQKTQQITEEKLLDMMGMPANWKRVTAYKKD